MEFFEKGQYKKFGYILGETLSSASTHEEMFLY